MITIDKKAGEHTIYEFSGHAESTDVCNGFSTLICTFCACLKREKPDLKYVFERRNGSICYEDGTETEYEGGEDYSIIAYTGKSRFEEFFDIGIESMREAFPGSFVNKG